MTTAANATVEFVAFDLTSMLRVLKLERGGPMCLQLFHLIVAAKKITCAAHIADTNARNQNAKHDTRCLVCGMGRTSAGGWFRVVPRNLYGTLKSSVKESSASRKTLGTHARRARVRARCKARAHTNK